MNTDIEPTASIPANAVRPMNVTWFMDRASARGTETAAGRNSSPLSPRRGKLRKQIRQYLGCHKRRDGSRANRKNGETKKYRVYITLLRLCVAARKFRNKHIDRNESPQSYKQEIRDSERRVVEIQLGARAEVARQKPVAKEREQG